MNKKIILLLLTLCFVLGFSSMASARHIDFENHTDFHWVGLYIDYEGHGRHWGENLLNSQIDRGEQVTLNVRGTRHELYKIKIVERSRGRYHEVIWHDVNLEDATRMIMRYDRRDRQAYYEIIRG